MIDLPNRNRGRSTKQNKNKYISTKKKYRQNYKIEIKVDLPNKKVLQIYQNEIQVDLPNRNRGRSTKQKSMVDLPIDNIDNEGFKCIIKQNVGEKIIYFSQP